MIRQEGLRLRHEKRRVLLIMKIYRTLLLSRMETLKKLPWKQQKQP